MVNKPGPHTASPPDASKIPGALPNSRAQHESSKKNKKVRKRKVPDFYEEPGWESGLKVYRDSSFERLRMPRAPHWSVAWADLMMTMFILFAVLYLYELNNYKEVLIGEGPGFDISSAIGSGVLGVKGGGSIGPAGEDEAAEQQLAKMYDLSRQVLDEGQLQEFAAVDLAPDKTVRIILTGDLLFASGRAEIKPAALKSLQKIIPLVAQTPYMVNVVGHTDDVPIRSTRFPSNWELSLVRASEVARYLMEKSGLPARRFYITGHASFLPLKPNTTPENRAANRRVEIVLTRQKPQGVIAGEADER